MFSLQASNGILRACFCSSPKGTTLSQPRVERREWSERTVYSTKHRQPFAQKGPDPFFSRTPDREML